MKNTRFLAPLVLCCATGASAQASVFHATWTAVPEPAAIVLIGAILLFSALHLRRRIAK